MAVSRPSWLTSGLQRRLGQLSVLLLFMYVSFMLGRSYPSLESTRESAYPSLQSTREQLNAVTSLASAPGPVPDFVRPFYVPAKQSALYQIAHKYNPTTDKFLLHTYEQMYSKHFEVDNRRFQKMKILEIGLGCDVSAGPGVSARLWREYFPYSEIWFAEYDSKCIDGHLDKLKALNVSVVTGDQGDVPTVQRWVKETRGAFDIIIDDGGHTSSHMYNSFRVLFPQALKPGGIYFIEDLSVNRWKKYRGSGTPVMMDMITDWVESIVTVNEATLKQLLHESPALPSDDVYYVPKYKLPKGVVSIECTAEMCAFIKCTADDERCPVGPGPDLSLPW